MLEKQRELAALLNTVRWEIVGMVGAYRTGRMYSSPPARVHMEKQRELAALLITVRWETVGMEGPYRTGCFFFLFSGKGSVVEKQRKLAALLNTVR